MHPIPESRIETLPDEISPITAEKKPNPSSKYVESKPSSRFSFVKFLLWLVPILAATAWLVILTILYANKLDSDSDNIIEAREVLLRCESNTDCKSPTQYCDEDYSHQCSACLQNSHCPNVEVSETVLVATTKVCDLFGTRSCFECMTDTDCGGIYANRPHCESVETRTCVDCVTDDQCNAPGEEFCVANECKKCINDAQCLDDYPTQPICNPAVGCVICMLDSQCSESDVGEFCLDSACSANQCNEDADCWQTPALPKCLSNSCSPASVGPSCNPSLCPSSACSGGYCTCTNEAPTCIEGTTCNTSQGMCCPLGGCV